MKIFKRGTTGIPGATFIPESRVVKVLKNSAGCTNGVNRVFRSRLLNFPFPLLTEYGNYKKSFIAGNNNNVFRKYWLDVYWIYLGIHSGAPNFNIVLHHHPFSYNFQIFHATILNM